MSGRVKKDKTKYECAYCNERFVKMTDHMSHVIEKHDRGFVEQSERLRRSVSCWHCGIVDVHMNAEGWFKCDQCGWELPRNWVNGQLQPEEDEQGDATQQVRRDD